MNTSRKRMAATILIVSGLGLVLLAHNPARGSEYTRTKTKGDAATQHRPATADLSVAFEQVAETIKPSLVNVSSVKEIKVSQQTRQLPHFFFGTPFGQQFGDDFFDRLFRQRAPEQGYVQQGLGTGVIVSNDGYVLTNNHVVNDADKVTVKLFDDRTFTAKVVGTDPKTDVAVLKIDTNGLHPATLGDSDELRVGEWVVAAGNPFGLTATITSGIVSAKGRANVGIADYEDFIQTDAAINPGNSGGPLLNLRGEVVGINTAIFTKSGGYMGVGFAIPIDMAKSIMHSLINDGKVVRGWLGVAIQNLNPGLSKSFGYEGTEGVLVGDVTPDGPAAKAGFQPGDIIVRFDGKKAVNIEKLRGRVAATKPNTTVRVDVFRSGKRKTFKVHIGELESQMVASGDQSAHDDLGMTVRTMTPDFAQQLGYDSNQHGVVVTNVEPLGIAARAGIRVKDVIVSVQDQRVENVSDFHRFLNKYDVNEGVRLGVRSGAMRRFVFLQSAE